MSSLPTPFGRLRLPVIGSPLFIVSGPELGIAQCKAGTAARVYGIEHVLPA